MKIKLVQPGYENMTGFFGCVEFIDGVSVDEVSEIEARRLGSVVAIRTLEGKDPSAAQMLIDLQSEPMALATTVPDAPEELVLLDHTPESLAAVADAGGIAGIRAIAGPLGIKGTSIAELIGKVLAVSKRRESDVAAAAAAVEGEKPADAPADAPAAE
jgi:hypothetical protein